MNVLSWFNALPLQDRQLYSDFVREYEDKTGGMNGAIGALVGRWSITPNQAAKCAAEYVLGNLDGRGPALPPWSENGHH